MATVHPIVWALAASAGSAILQHQLRQRPNKVLQDIPMTLSSRGSRIPIIIGIANGGSIVAWTSQTERKLIKEKVKGAGKGFGGSGGFTEIFYEPGFHIGCTGPAQSIRRIRQGGETIFEGVISRDSHPTGTLVDLGSEGTFYPRWGEEIGEEDEYLAAEGRMGVLSSWPLVAGIVWTSKRLGQVAQWPNLEVDWEVRPEVDPALGLDPNKHWIFNTVAGASQALGKKHQVATRPGGPDEGYFVVPSQPFSDFPPGELLSVTGHPVLNPPNPWYTGDPSIPPGLSYSDTIRRVEATTVSDLLAEEMISSVGFNGPPATSFLSFGGVAAAAGSAKKAKLLATKLLKVYPQLGIPPEAKQFLFQNTPFTVSWPTTTRIQGSSNQDRDGANAMAIAAQLIFSEPPFGMGADREDWDLESLRIAHERLYDERYAASITLGSDMTVMGALSVLFQDIGCFITSSPDTGKLQFRLLRRDLLTKYTIPERALRGAEPEHVKTLMFSESPNVIFSFKDRAQGYNTATVRVLADGSAALQTLEGATEVDIGTATDFNSAAQVAIRRGQELQGDTDGIVFTAGFGATRIRPGDVVELETMPGREWLVSKAHPEADSPNVAFAALPDSFLAPPSGLEFDQEVPLVSQQTPAANLIADPWTLPSALSPLGAVLVAFLRVRKDFQTGAQLIYASNSQSTLTVIASDLRSQPGGTLIEGLEAVIGDVDVGPLMTFMGPDESLIQDLTSADDAWENGQQLLVAFPPDGGQAEVMFLKAVTFVTAFTLRLLGLRRAQYGTLPQLLGPGSRCYIVSSTGWTAIANPIFVPLSTVYYKLQPVGTGPTQSLASIPLESFVVPQNTLILDGAP